MIELPNLNHNLVFDPNMTYSRTGRGKKSSTKGSNLNVAKSRKKNKIGNRERQKQRISK